MVKLKLREETKSRWDRNRHKINIIETDQGERCYDIPLQDVDALMNLYDSLPHPKIQNQNWDFVIDINWRIYTEWCMDNEWRKSRDDYSGDVFKDFVREEAHFELVRKSYEWNEREKRFEDLSGEEYQQTRQRVLGGLALKAIELFSDWDGVPYPLSRVEKGNDGFEVYSRDQRNLRGSLTEYIVRYDSLKQQNLTQKV